MDVDILQTVLHGCTKFWEIGYFSISPDPLMKIIVNGDNYSGVICFWVRDQTNEYFCQVCLLVVLGTGVSDCTSWVKGKLLLFICHVIYKQ